MGKSGIDIIRRGQEETEATEASDVEEGNVTGRDDATPPLRLPTQELPVVFAVLDDNHRNNEQQQDVHIAVASSSIIPPATTSTAPLPIAVAAIGNAHGTTKSIPTVHAAQILPQITTQPPPRRPLTPPRPRLHPMSMTMNEAIDRTVALSQQRREALIAEGTVIVEDYSSTRIDLDRVDAFYVNFERRDIVRRFVFKYFRTGIYAMGMAVAWIIATPLFFKACAFLGLHDLRFTPAFRLALVPYLLILFCGMQPLGALLMYWTNRLREEMLPRRNGRGTLTQVLLSGACCFCDNVLSREQFWRLLAVEVVNAAGFYLCGAAAIMVVVGVTPKILDDDAVGAAMFLWALFSLPAWGWYRLIQYLHMCILTQRHSTDNQPYNVVATADTVIDHPAGVSVGNSTLEMV